MVSRAVLAVLAASGLALCGCIPEKVAGENWGGPAASPSDQQFTSRKAVFNHVEGAAILVCIQAPEGRITGCRVELETPAGYGFADSALRMADQMVIRSHQLPVGETVVVPVSFCPSARQKPACEARSAALAEQVRAKIG
ncbi:hypothetical protein [Caulobacter hibisci]|uniref:TonB C-terminal domain-containing protein n=1 Tax=Caulobacter hibisci TaxID=2035993 RepID=A0ABS0SS83_9CAUL|nr:hypothetical protein [Caulobacter hibisci]MBI1682467.1 hypothetical protein [Caulobacter hibisci]